MRETEETIEVGPRLLKWQVLVTGPKTSKAKIESVLYMSEYFETEEMAKERADILWLDQLRMNPLLHIWVARRWVF